MFSKWESSEMTIANLATELSVTGASVSFLNAWKWVSYGTFEFNMVCKLLVNRTFKMN